MNSRRGSPAIWAVGFAVFDAVLLLSIRLSALAEDYTDLRLNEDSLHEKLVGLWNIVHKPVRIFVEPILFPVITFHPPTPSAAIFLLYEILCVVQFFLVGYAVGLTVFYIRRRINRFRQILQ